MDFDPSLSAMTAQAFGTRIGNPLLHEENETLIEGHHLNLLNTTFCGLEHAGHEQRSKELCYLYFLSKCDSKTPLPLVPKTSQHLLSPGILPRGAPLLDHVDVLLRSQSNCKAGGSFRPFLKSSMKVLKTHRQVCLDTNPSVQSVVYGVSSSEEVLKFISDFNQKMAELQNPGEGSFPFEFFHFDVLFCRTPTGVTPKIAPSMKNIGDIIGEPLVDIPARILLGFWDQRFDIVFNYEYTDMNQSTFEADFKLIMKRTCLEDIWHNIFSKFKGYAVGVDLPNKINKLFRFLEACFSYRNCSGQPVLKHIDLNVLLAISGWNYHTADACTLNFMCTGGVLLRPWELQYGLGQLHLLNMPKSVNIYLQSECQAVLNTALLCSIIWMLHWFVTPGIANLFTRKDPIKFLKWFSSFQVHVLRGAFLPDLDLKSELGCRKASPTSLIAKIEYLQEFCPAISPEELSYMIPPWGNVIESGCRTDLDAFDHLLYSVHPLLTAQNIPGHLRLQSNSVLVGTALSGKSQPVISGIPDRDALGCRPDQALLFLPDLMSKDVTDGCKVTVSHAYEIYLKHINDMDPVKSHSLVQIAILFAWKHQVQFLKLYSESCIELSGFDYFKPEELDVLIPLDVDK